MTFVKACSIFVTRPKSPLDEPETRVSMVSQYRGSQKMKKKARAKRPYEKPTVTKLTPQQARLKLTPHAEKGHEGAKELLELMSPKDSKTKKKSA